jgi:hypothetical protein
LGFFKIEESNDIFSADNQDRYFTQGLKLELTSPKVGRFYNRIWINRLLPKLIQDTANYNHYSLSFTQDFYTPSDKTSDTIVPDDRPFAGAIYLTFRNYSISSDLKQRLTSELSIGAIGPVAQAQQMQNGVHKMFANHNADTNIKGWNYQLNNDLYLNYKLSFEQRIFFSSLMEANSIYQFNVGTAFTDFGIGGRVRLGKFKSFFDKNMGLLNHAERNTTFPQFLKGIQVYFFYAPVVKMVLYNAMLQGGVVNKLNNTVEHRIQSDAVSRLVVAGSYGMAMVFGRFNIILTEYFNSKEFETGSVFSYGTVILTYSW